MSGLKTRSYVPSETRVIFYNIAQPVGATRSYHPTSAWPVNIFNFLTLSGCLWIEYERNTILRRNFQ